MPPTCYSCQMGMTVKMWLRAIALGAFALSAGCGSPTEPDRVDPRVPPAVGMPTFLTMDPCEYLATTANCPVVARWGELYSTSRAVTGVAQWVSSAPGVVRVAYPGILERVAPGDAEVRVSFNGKTESIVFRVVADGPPWRVFSGTEYHIRVVDRNAQHLEGVLVEVTAGMMAGHSAISDRNGSAIFRDAFVCGPITVRASKGGYQIWTGSAVNCGKAGNGAWGSETIEVRMLAN